MAGIDPWALHSLETDRAVLAGINTLLRLIQTNPGASFDELTALVHGTTNLTRQVVASSAVRALRNSRALHGAVGLPDPVEAGPVEYRQIQASMAWALRDSSTGEWRDALAVTQKIAGFSTRAMRDGSRETVIASVEAARTRWARVPGTKACAWCLMLASRGAVYSSQDKAMAASGKRGKQQSGKGFHDNCTCIVVESHTPTDLPKIVVDLHHEWESAVGIGTHPDLSAGDQRDRWAMYVKATRPNGTSIQEAAVVRDHAGNKILVDGDKLWQHTQFRPLQNNRPMSTEQVREELSSETTAKRLLQLMAGAHVEHEGHSIIAEAAQRQGLELRDVKHIYSKELAQAVGRLETVSQVLSEPETVGRSGQMVRQEKTVVLGGNPYLVRVGTGPSKHPDWENLNVRVAQVNTCYALEGEGVGRINQDGTFSRFKEGRWTP